VQGTSDQGTVTVPAIPEEQAESIPGAWIQPRGVPTARGFWGPDIAAPFDTLWRIDTGMEFFAAPAMSGGVLYFGGNDGRFRAVEASTGRELWSHSTACGLNGEAAADSSRVYFGGQDGYVYALDAADGGVEWTAGLGYHLFSGVGILADSLIVTGNSEGEVAALRSSDGSVAWHDPVGGIVSGPVIVDTIIVFTTEDGIVGAWGPSGSRLWVRDFQGLASPPSSSGDAVYAGFSDGMVRRLDTADGSVEWETDLAIQPVRTVLSRPVVAGSRILVGTCDSRLVCLSAEDGGIVWEAGFENWVQVPPSVGDSTVYVSCDDQRFHVLDLGTGAPIDSIEMGGYAGTAPLIVNGVIYLGTASGEFMAFRGTPRNSAEDAAR
jgi:outer membrane protein assembly factor BamB